MKKKEVIGEPRPTQEGGGEVLTLETALEHCKKNVQTAGGIDAQRLKDTMEPVWRKCGYRAALSIGERQRILVVRDDAAGDFILFSPFLRELRRIYPDAMITLVASPRNEALAHACPYIDELICNPMEATGAVAAFSSISEFVQEHLLPRRFAIGFASRLGVYSMSLLTLYLSGAQTRIGWSQNRRNPLTGKLIRPGWDCLLSRPVPFYEKAPHDVDRNLYLLEDMLHLPISDRRLEVWYTPREREEALRILAEFRSRFTKLYAVVPGASIPMKQWPARKYGETMREIFSHEPQAGCVLLGGAEDVVAASEVAAMLPGRVISLAGKLPFRISAAVMGEMSCYIGNDTGLLHIAAAQHVPVLCVSCYPSSIGLSSMSIPVRFAPYRVPSVTVMPREARGNCHDVFEYGCNHHQEAHCILGVEKEAVLRAWHELRERIIRNDIRPLYLR